MKGRIVKGKVLIKPAKQEKTTASGIIIPNEAQQKAEKGVIVIIGENPGKEPVEFVIGDTVQYSQFAGQEFEIENENYVLITYKDILYIE